MHADAIMRLELSAELPAAIERGELELHYQPIVGLDGRPTGGAEALVRWRHPRRGLLAPGAFIEPAESTGAIVALGRWVIEQACADVARWQREAGAARLFVSVNVSQAQLADDAFVDHVEAALARSGLAPSARPSRPSCSPGWCSSAGASGSSSSPRAWSGRSRRAR
jgi:EAL domain-containing protein (putative c-di-GMP-specific phosphodiesterase class I)